MGNGLQVNHGEGKQEACLDQAKRTTTRSDDSRLRAVGGNPGIGTNERIHQIQFSLANQNPARSVEVPSPKRTVRDSVFR